MKTVSAKNRVSYYIRYTLLFIVTALVIYAPFLVMKKSFVWEHDSYTQHLKAMVYISRWYRQTLKALLHGNFKAISTYSFSIGYGSDAMTTGTAPRKFQGDLHLFLLDRIRLRRDDDARLLRCGRSFLSSERAGACQIYLSVLLSSDPCQKLLHGSCLQRTLPLPLAGGCT